MKKPPPLSFPSSVDLNVNFEELFNLKEIQRLQDHFAEATGIGSIITHTDGTPITRPSNFCHLCSICIRENNTGAANCVQSNISTESLYTEGPIIKTCSKTGFWHASVDITVKGRHLAHWFIGPVRNDAQDKDAAIVYAQKMGICETKIVDTFREIPSMSCKQLERIARLLFTTATQLSTTAYQNLKQERIISDRHKVEGAIKESENHRATLDNLMVGVIVHASDTRILFNNSKATKILGLTSAQINGKGTKDHEWGFIYENSTIMEVEDYPVSQVLSKKKAIHDLVLGIKRPDRTAITWVVVNAVPVFSHTREVEKVIVSFLEYTDRKVAKELLQRNKDLLNRTQQLTKIGGWEFNPESQTTYWTDEVFRMHDLPPDIFNPQGGDGQNQSGDGFLGRAITIDQAIKVSLSCYDSDDQQVVADAFRECVKTGKPYDLEMPFTTKKGRRIWVRTIANALSENGRVVKVTGSFIDVTDRKQAEEKRRLLEEQLHQAVKLEALGTLAGGVAHDFNNILSSILGHSIMALEELPQSSTAHEDIQQVMASANRAADLVKQILLFSRQETEKYHPLKIQETIEEIVSMFGAALPSSIDFSQSIDHNCGEIYADPTQMHQVLMNLCTNSRQAIQSDYGSISIELSEVTPLPSFFKRHSDIEQKSKKYACIEVRDTGCGIPLEIQTKIFDPFFTTKPQQKGTGLGLAVVDSIVRKHHGLITLESTTETGTLVQVYLPIVEPVPSTEVFAIPSKTEGSERILLVDDEVILCKLYQRSLERLGYQVTSFTDSARALNYFQQNSTLYDIVITDMTMPTLTGFDLIKEIVKICPDTKSILCTGYSNSISEPMAMDFGISAFLVKPFSPRTLAETIRKVIDHA